MSLATSTRTSRRLATQKKVVVEDSDEEMPDIMPPKEEQDDEDEFAPAPQRSPQRQTRRKTTGVSSTPRTAARSRRTRTGENVEPSQIFEADATLAPEPISPTKKSSPRKRKSEQATRKFRVSVSIDQPPPLPTPKLSATPEPSQLHGIPLADITNATINEKAPLIDSQKVIEVVRPMDLVLEKPMDIVVRSRALAVPAATEPTSPRARTVIKCLVLMNFKSYAGRQEVGPFHASFSSVVGPNGSGKSNVIDSLLFVFGFRASKMRQGKISALIHNSAAFPNLDFCEVEVHFEEVMDLVGCRKTHNALSANSSSAKWTARDSS